MAENTLGRRIVEKQPVLKIFGDEIPLRAQVEVMNGFSAHADQKGLMAFINGIKKGPDAVFVVHGEYESANTLAEIIRSGGPDVHVPKRHDKFQI